MITGDSTPEHASPKPATRRLFLAISLSDVLRGQIADLSHRLQKGAQFTALQASWVPPENFHMTLHFLGPVDSSKVPDLEAALRTLGEDLRPFTLRFRGLGYFPHNRAPRVLWLGVSKAPAELELAVSKSADVLRSAGIALQHDNFHAHITLARFKSLKGTAPFVNIAKNYSDAAPGECGVERLVLMESLFTKGAPEYREVMEIPLRAAGG